jgi:hypothetical protein
MDKQHAIRCKSTKKRASMTTNISSLVLHTSDGEFTFEASGEYWIWKATAQTTNARYDQAITITLPQVEHLNIPTSKMNCSPFWRGPLG